MLSLNNSHTKVAIYPGDAYYPRLLSAAAIISCHKLWPASARDNKLMKSADLLVIHPFIPFYSQGTFILKASLLFEPDVRG